MSANRSSQNKSGNYLQDLPARMWDYRANRFAGLDSLFYMDHVQKPLGPPVFLRSSAEYNIIVDPINTSSHAAVTSAIPLNKRHTWFRSMKSSQALAQSVFANLASVGKLGLLSAIPGTNNKPLFPINSKTTCSLEAELSFNSHSGTNILGEQHRGCTSIDVLLDEGKYRVAVECKLSEAYIGKCSKVDEEPQCYLTGKGIKYWDFATQLFDWPKTGLCGQCGLRDNYQLVRNILAVTAEENNTVDPNGGHVVLLYDERNPAFYDGGKGMNAWEDTQSHLLYPGLLQKCTWQEIVTVLRTDPTLNWLTEELGVKYGL